MTEQTTTRWYARESGPATHLGKFQYDPTTGQSPWTRVTVGGPKGLPFVDLTDEELRINESQIHPSNEHLNPYRNGQLTTDPGADDKLVALVDLPKADFEREVQGIALEFQLRRLGALLDMREYDLRARLGGKDYEDRAATVSVTIKARYPGFRPTARQRAWAEQRDQELYG